MSGTPTTVVELRKLAKSAGMANVSNSRKHELLDYLEHQPEQQRMALQKQQNDAPPVQLSGSIKRRKQKSLQPVVVMGSSSSFSLSSALPFSNTIDFTSPKESGHGLTKTIKAANFSGIVHDIALTKALEHAWMNGQLICEDIHTYSPGASIMSKLHAWAAEQLVHPDRYYDSRPRFEMEVSSTPSTTEEGHVVYIRARVGLRLGRMTVIIGHINSDIQAFTFHLGHFYNSFVSNLHPSMIVLHQRLFPTLNTTGLMTRALQSLLVALVDNNLLTEASSCILGAFDMMQSGGSRRKLLLFYGQIGFDKPTSTGMVQGTVSGIIQAIQSRPCQTVFALGPIRVLSIAGAVWSSGFLPATSLATFIALFGQTADPIV